MQDNARPIRTFIVAGNGSEFLYWCRENQCNPYDKFILCIRDSGSLRGYVIFPEDEVIYYGTYYNRRDLVEIENEIRVARHHG